MILTNEQKTQRMNSARSLLAEVRLLDSEVEQIERERARLLEIADLCLDYSDEAAGTGEAGIAYRPSPAKKQGKEGLASATGNPPRQYNEDGTVKPWCNCPVIFECRKIQGVRCAAEEAQTNVVRQLQEWERITP